MSTRTQKIANVIQREVAQFFSEILDEKEYGIVTVTRVEVMKDLSEARIYVSVMENTKNFIALANKRSRRIRSRVRPRLFLKKIPQFSFFLDSSGAYAEKIEKLL